MRVGSQGSYVAHKHMKKSGNKAECDIPDSCLGEAIHFLRCYYAIKCEYHQHDWFMLVAGGTSKRLSCNYINFYGSKNECTEITFILRTK